MSFACPHCTRQVTDADILMTDIIDWSGCPLAQPCAPRQQPGQAWPMADDDGDASVEVEA